MEPHCHLMPDVIALASWLSKNKGRSLDAPTLCCRGSSALHWTDTITSLTNARAHTHTRTRTHTHASLSMVLCLFPGHRVRANTFQSLCYRSKERYRETERGLRVSCVWRAALQSRDR